MQDHVELMQDHVELMQDHVELMQDHVELMQRLVPFLKPALCSGVLTPFYRVVVARSLSRPSGQQSVSMKDRIIISQSLNLLRHIPPSHLKLHDRFLFRIMQVVSS
ncbi:hypothetical protein Bpfe_006294 [Biomphalaria pfeifferi]|uniref:Uncharacterized protein n=1 Tax=Biomphalaria pfeifferi TaxID=112525 RepID=A0AAD8C082_BIOPF|nr:hypothetical protein Bpfe_006294 [Biomphalaria pfeifferi]